VGRASWAATLDGRRVRRVRGGPRRRPSLTARRIHRVEDSEVAQAWATVDVFWLIVDFRLVHFRLIVQLADGLA
jgi:hypothetical protein